MSKENKSGNYVFFVGVFGLLLGSTILFLPLLRTFLSGEVVSVYSYALINFLSYLFITSTFIELLFIQLIRLGGNPVVFTLVAVSTALLALSVDYLIGYTFSKSFLTKFVSERKIKKYQARIEKYGDPVIFVFNVFPLASPLLTLVAGLLRYNKKRIFFFSFLGLSIKYTSIAIFLTFFL